MGSSGKEEVGIADCGVGSIVWVRRRNGSWWPGKILGSEELSAAHLVSPRSGTPVKLLGREDASVDWYNLEKSKRVKPFRCGEFDECIEKAEAALGLPPKKREKYARREDAILHALELEKQLLDNKSSTFGLPADGCNKSSDTVKIESVIYSECLDYDNEKNVNLKPGSKKLLVSADKDIDDSIRPPEVNGVTQMGDNVNISELLPRVRGSRGLGLRSSRAKEKLSSSTSLNGPDKLELDNLDKFDNDLPIRDFIYESSVIPGIRTSLEKKRKSAEDVPTNESLAKRRDRRRTLVQVLQKSEKMSSKSSLQLLGEENVEPTNIESNNCYNDDQLVGPSEISKSPSHMEVENFSPPTALDEEKASESTESTETDSSKTHSMNSDEDGLAEPASLLEVESEISGRAPHENDTSHLYSHDPVPDTLGISTWQSKRKRNNRSISKRSSKATDPWVAIGSVYTADLDELQNDGFIENDARERNFSTQKRPSFNQGYDDESQNVTDWENLAWNEQPLARGYWEGPSNHLGPTLGKMKSGLVDVDLKVQTSHQREHVPMISLMSKLNGKAIIGHPIQVQILEYGSTDSLLSSQENIENSENANLKKKAPFRKPGMARKGLARGKFSKKTPKKKRNLSAIGNHSASENKNSFQASEMIKHLTTVACIPVKLVFCRLNEELVDRHNKT